MRPIPETRTIQAAVHDAAEQTNRVEQRAIALLHERGYMSGLTCDQQREVERIVRTELLTPAGKTG
jgi:hypothetical protein